jgi:hypothetical protein
MSEHIFIIRIWAENRDIEGASPQYRGVIQHASSGEKQYLENTNAVKNFMLPYLEEMGIDTDQRDPLNDWLRNQKKS